jgi:hypothetical protein
MPRPSYKPTDESRRLVKSLATTGTRHTDIAEKLSVSHDTLAKYYANELRDGRIDANAKVAQALFQQAVNGNVTAMIFWLKTRAGWKEADRLELSATGDAKSLTFKWATPEES